MNAHDVVKLLSWFSVYEGEVGFNESDLETLKSLLDILKDSDFPGDVDHQNHKDLYEYWMDHLIPIYEHKLSTH